MGAGGAAGRHAPTACWPTRPAAAIDLIEGITFRAQGPPFAVIVIERETPQAVLTALADLTGHMPLPPRWALGYHQCRYSYYPAAQVREVAREFRRRSIPCDVIWLDIDYMDGFRCSRSSRAGFPDPRALNDSLHAAGFRSVWIIDPGIKRDPGYSVFQQGNAGDHWVKARERRGLRRARSGRGRACSPTSPGRPRAPGGAAWWATSPPPASTASGTT